MPIASRKRPQRISSGMQAKVSAEKGALLMYALVGFYTENTIRLTRRGPKKTADCKQKVRGSKITSFLWRRNGTSSDTMRRAIFRMAKDAMISQSSDDPKQGYIHQG